MRLRKISLKGFKSFADRTDILFDDGITVVVGPNGSGKSNISDAIRWVLGEMSLKVLRGSKMEDVIYKGSDNRRALGFAEVEIVLDNSDGALPIEYTEVSITRRLYKSGESNYFINQNPCRQKDIRYLFMDTGVGKEGYSIIGQGRIDEILSEKPEDRRAIFEEVAGISKFRSKKEESLRKLDKTDESLVRINDIIFELEGNYEESKIEADRTRKYNDLFYRLKEIDISQSLRELDKNIEGIKKEKEELLEIESLLSAKEEEVKKLDESFESLKESLNESKGLADSFDEKLSSYIENLNQLQIEKEKLENKRSFYSLNMDTIEVELESKRQEIINSKDFLANLTEERRAIEGNLSNILNEGESIESKIKDLNPSLDELTLKEQNLKNTFQDIRLNIESLSKEEEYEKTSLEEVGKKLEEIDLSLPEKGARLEFLNSELRMVNGEIEDFEKKLIAYREDVENLERRTKNIEKEENTEKEEKHRIEIELSRSESELKTIRAMEDNLEGYQRSVRAIIKKYQGKNQVRGVLSDLFNVDSKYETALEVALASSLQNVVVEKDSDAKEIIEYLKAERAGRATFLPMNRINGYRAQNPPLKANGVIGLASDLISFDKEYRNIFENLLGRTLLVENMDVALSLGRESIKGLRLVTLQGEIFNAGGSITGGFIGEKGSGLISRKNKILELEEKNIKFLEKIKEIDQRLDIKRELKSRIDEEFTLKEEEVSTFKDSRREKFNKKSEIEQELGILKSSYNSLKEQKEELASREEALKKNIITIRESLLNNKKEYRELEGKIEEVKEEIGKESDVFRALNEERNKLSMTRLNLENRIKNLSEKIGDQENRIEGLESRINQLESKKAEEENENKEETNRIEDLLTEINELEEKLEDLRERRSSEKKREEEILNKYYETQKVLSDINSHYQEIEKNKSDLELKMSRRDLKNESITERLEREYDFLPSEGFEIPKINMSQTMANKEINRLREEIRELGTINPIAIEREIELGNRLELMKSQEADLILSKEDLKKIIADIEKEMSSMFKDTIEVVNKLFNEVYKNLFNGGEAELKLKDDDDPLNTGIEILITPEGKKRQAISLLSGGEKALTAIALLFAIQRLKPSPFCVLDEIDAALDDQNIDRFTKYLTSKLNDIQFIIVTHRKRTMEIGDIIYGVSMMEDGVSTLLSMKLK